MRRPATYPSTAGSLARQLLSEPRRPARVRESPRAHWYVVGTVCIGAFMGQLDVSIVTLALPHIGRAFQVGVGAVEWVALAYLVVLVATIAAVGRLADAVGRKLLYVYGFAVFTAASVLCGLAPTLSVLIAARVLQAVGASMLQANSVALITEALPRPLLGRGIGIQGTAQAVGLALGPAIGGALLALGGWRLIFLVNLPAGAVGLALGWFLLPRSRSRRPIGGADRAGAPLLALAAAGPLVYLSLGSRAGYANPVLLAALAVGILSAILFARREHRLAAPLIDLSILRARELRVGLGSGLVSYMVLFGALFAVPYYLTADHVSPALVGLQLAMLPIGIAVAAPVAGRLLNRAGHRPLTTGGLIVVAVGLVGLAVWPTTPGLLVGLALAGLGLGAFTPANNATIMAAAPPGHAGVLSGLLNMTRGMGTALGVALAGALYIAQGLSVTLGTLGLLALATGAAMPLGKRRQAGGSTRVLRWRAGRRRRRDSSR